MKIVIAPDSFKGSLSSVEVASAMADGVRAAAPDSEIVQLPLGDGGEGTLDALLQATGGSLASATVRGPLGDRIEARYGLLEKNTAFIEMAEASGLSRVYPSRRDPLAACSYGTGELIRAAALRGCRRIIIGLGGSATSDGGAGLLRALGLRLLDAEGRELPPGGAALEKLSSIDRSAWEPPACEIEIASDVTNPLLGPDGAAAVYGPQKGAAPEDVQRLDSALARFADVVECTVGGRFRDQPGAGAAGGCGFGLLAFLGARFGRGAELMLDLVEIDRHLDGAALVLTGEGMFDWQSIEYGKTIGALAARASARRIPVLVLAGGIGERLGDYRAAGVAGASSIIPRPITLAQALSLAAPLIRDGSRRLIEVFLSGSEMGRG